MLDLRWQINQAENSLALLLAETPRHYERGSLAQQQFPTDFSVGIPVQMLSGRPDVRSAERSLEAAFYGTNKARSAFYPSITLSGSAGWTNSAGVMILNPGQVSGICCRIADATALQPRTGSCPVSHCPCTAGRSRTWLPANLAQCRQRGERCINSLSDQSGQETSVG